MMTTLQISRRRFSDIIIQQYCFDKFTVEPWQDLRDKSRFKENYLFCKNTVQASKQVETNMKIL